MAIDITTLAIKIQSQEAERNLRTFNELLSLSSHTAKKIEKVSIEVDVNGALAQLHALKAEYSNLAASAKSAYAEMERGSTAFVAPATDAENLNALKDFFASTAEMSKAMREEMTQFNEALAQLEANSVKTATAGGAHIESMSNGATMSREYAAALKEVAAAQKEMEKTAAQADEAMKATVAADEDAEAVKKRLTQAQRELTSISKQLAETHRTMSGDIIGLSVKEEELKNKVAELKSVYEEAKAAAEKFNRKLEDAGEKADAARQRYQELKAQLDAMPKPMAQISSGASDFSKEARGAATQATKMARGFNAVAYSAGAAVPGLNKIGRVIGTFAYAGPVVGGIVVGVGALAAGIKHLWEESQRGYRLAHEHAVQAIQDARQVKDSFGANGKLWDRLGELASLNSLNNEQNAEAKNLIAQLTDAYGFLGIEIDKTTRKLKGYGRARSEAAKEEREFLKLQLQGAVGKAEADLTGEKEILSGENPWSSRYSEAQKAVISKRLKDMEGLSRNGQLKFLINWKNELQRVVYGQGKYMGVDNTPLYYDDPTTGGRSEVDMRALAEVELDHLQRYIEKWNALEKAKKLAAEVEGADSAKIGALDKERKRLTDALTVGDAGNTRLKNANELYLDQKKRLAEIAATQARLKNADPQAFTDEPGAGGKTVGVFWAELEKERLQLLTSTLRYEEKITREKERQEERERREAIALQEKIANLKKSYTFYTDGKVEKKDSTAQDADRKMEMTRYEDLSKSVNERTRTEAQYRLMGLQIEQLNADEQNNRARKQWEKGRSRFVYDKKGNVVREKNEVELAADRKKEIAAAEAKAAKYTRGSTEWYGAMAELDRLRQEDFKKRQETSFANLGFSQMQAHNNMTQSVEARSSQALRLETRNFSKPDNAWKKIEATQSQFYNLFRDTVPSNIESLTNSVNSMKEKLVQV